MALGADDVQATQLPDLLSLSPGLLSHLDNAIQPLLFQPGHALHELLRLDQIVGQDRPDKSRPSIIVVLKDQLGQKFRLSPRIALRALIAAVE